MDQRALARAAEAQQSPSDPPESTRAPRGPSSKPTPLILGLLAALLAACAGVEEPSDPVLPPRTIGPEARPARLFVPSDYDPDQSYPLVLMLHGFQVTGDLQNIVLGLRERVTPQGFVLIIPEGTRDSRNRPFWNAGPECCNFDGIDVDDVSYLSGLVEEASSVVSIDPARIAAVGHSNGGYMSLRLACDRPDLFRRAVSVAGSMPLDATRCADPDPVSILHIHGSLDDVVPYQDNRDGEPGAGHFIVSAGAHDTVERWRLSNGCPETPDLVESLDLLSDVPGEETTASSWTTCATGERVVFFDMEGGDHLLLRRTATFQDRIASFATAAH